MFRLYGCAEFFQTFDVQVYRPRPNGTASRQRHSRPSGSGKQRPEYEHRGPHRLYQIVGRFMRQNLFGSQSNRVVALEFDRGAEFPQ